MALASEAYVFFVAGCLAAFYALPRRARPVFLLVASLYFYVTWNAWYVAALLALATADWALALAIESAAGRRRRLLLVAGVALNLAFLGTFKYVNFATGTLAALVGRPADDLVVRLIVPVGISFHTFQSISYLVDVACGRLRARRSLPQYALYLAFFPQLLAGPIVRAERFFAELDGWRAPSGDDVMRGLREIVQGSIKKLVLADAFAAVADAYFGDVAGHPGAAAAWSGALAFTWQIYFDFSGYSDIAIGTARLFGFAFPQNFLRPYYAATLTEFWQRWHVSLSSWLRDYLYIPLGGNRRGRLTTERNLLVTMLLGGLWHGAGFTFVAWGGYHGAWLALERALGRRRVAATGLARGAGIVTTFGLVLAGWVLFRAATFGDALATYRALVAGGPGPWLLDGWCCALAAIGFGVEALAASGRVPAWTRWPPLAQGTALGGLVLVLQLCAASGPARTFVYFKF